MTEVRTVSATGGEKGEKDERYDLIPVEPLAEIARVFAYGATKYADRNWEKGYEWHKSYAALQRHVNAFWNGESIDPESGRHHLAHAAFHLLVLMQFEEHHPNYDDRSQLVRVVDMPPLGPPPEAEVEDLPDLDETGDEPPVLRLIGAIDDCTNCDHARSDHRMIGGGWRTSTKFHDKRGACLKLSCRCWRYTSV